MVPFSGAPDTYGSSHVPPGAAIARTGRTLLEPQTQTRQNGFGFLELAAVERPRGVDRPRAPIPLEHVKNRRPEGICFVAVRIKGDPR